MIVRYITLQQLEIHLINKKQIENTIPCYTQRRYSIALILLPGVNVVIWSRYRVDTDLMLYTFLRCPDDVALLSKPRSFIGYVSNLSCMPELRTISQRLSVLPGINN